MAAHPVAIARAAGQGTAIHQLAVCRFTRKMNSLRSGEGGGGGGAQALPTVRRIQARTGGSRSRSPMAQEAAAAGGPIRPALAQGGPMRAARQAARKKKPTMKVGFAPPSKVGAGMVGLP